MEETGICYSFSVVAEEEEEEEEEGMEEDRSPPQFHQTTTTTSRRLPWLLLLLLLRPPSPLPLWEEGEVERETPPWPTSPTRTSSPASMASPPTRRTSIRRSCSDTLCLFVNFEAEFCSEEGSEEGR